MKILTTKTNIDLVRLVRELRLKTIDSLQCEHSEYCGQGAFCNACELKHIINKLDKIIDTDSKIL